MCQKCMRARLGTRWRRKAGQRCQMVILSQTTAGSSPHSSATTVAKASVDVPIVVPVPRLKECLLQVEVTQGPQGTIRKAILKTSYLCSH